MFFRRDSLGIRHVYRCRAGLPIALSSFCTLVAETVLSSGKRRRLFKAWAVPRRRTVVCGFRRSPGGRRDAAVSFEGFWVRLKSRLRLSQIGARTHSRDRRQGRLQRVHEQTHDWMSRQSHQSKKQRRWPGLRHQRQDKMSSARLHRHARATLLRL